MKTSDAGLSLIKKFEGCRLVAYKDTTGIWTIGWGETGSYVVEGLHYTQQQAEDGLARRLATEFEPGVTTALAGAPVTQAQFDAMVSLAWNIGVGAFAKSSVARFHRADDYAGAADAFRMWNKAGGQVLDGLKRRREAERALYLSAGKPAENIPDTSPVKENRGNRDPLADLMRAVQRVVDTEPDGIFGPHTAAAITRAQQGGK